MITFTECNIFRGISPDKKCLDTNIARYNKLIPKMHFEN